jgi:hypothetical protein
MNARRTTIERNRYEEYKDFRKARATHKAEQKARVIAEKPKSKKPLKEIVSDFAFGFSE